MNATPEHYLSSQYTKRESATDFGNVKSAFDTGPPE